MLSTGLHQYVPAFAQFSPYETGEQQHSSPSDASRALGTLAPAPHHRIHQLHNTAGRGRSILRQRQHSYLDKSLQSHTRGHREAILQERQVKSAAGAQPVRRRISRACDQCNQLRTKCDGKGPCAHCVEFSLTCEYVRERKKRGKASRKDVAQQQAAEAAAAVASSNSARQSPLLMTEFSEDYDAVNEQDSERFAERSASFHDNTDATCSGGQYFGQLPSGTINYGARVFHENNTTARLRSHINANDAEARIRLPRNNDSIGSHTAPHFRNTASPGENLQLMDTEYVAIDEYQRPTLSQTAGTTSGHAIRTGPGLPRATIPAHNIPTYADSHYAAMSPQGQHGQSQGFRLTTAESPLSGFMGSSSVSGSPGWFSLPSPAAAMYPNQAQLNVSHHVLRYPVLQPLLPHLRSIMPASLACDLLDVYFQSSSTAFVRPVSPYVLGYVFRKQSFLRQERARECSPALLASMLWIGAQTSESAVLTASPAARGKIRQKLLELTVSLLKPLVHSSSLGDPSPLYGSDTTVNRVALGTFGAGTIGRQQEQDGASTGSTGSVDDVATYLHIATVVSASENKAASLRWWNAAWSLSRELKLGRELPPISSQTSTGSSAAIGADAEVDIGMTMRPTQLPASDVPKNSTGTPSQSYPEGITEERREERRRIWWILYAMDRHLALCYNRPLFLLDIECDGLLQPLDDAVWQAGEFFDEEASGAHDDPCSPYYRRRGPPFECSGLSIFGFFLPLMTILGGIVDLNHARNHPRSGFRLRGESEWDYQAEDLIRQLDAYQQSLRQLQDHFASIVADTGADLSAMEGSHHETGTPAPHSMSSVSKVTEVMMQLKIVVVYATHLMHTLHILLNGKWDPISLLDDNDLWISSHSFISATGHAVSAAEALNDVLHHDPDLSFMPFFFGIYLLQSSFLLLLIAEKLQGEASPNIVKACETIVKAHEACVVTLSTEYQRNFRRVMSSALAQVRGRLLEDYREAQRRRREVLALYRWTGDGSGLAL